MWRMDVRTARAAFLAALPQGLAVTDPDLLGAVRSDRLLAVDGGMPFALVRARSTADVSAVLRAASAYDLPVVPRGAGSGLSGGATAIDGCVVLSLMAMDRIIEVDPADGVAVVQPGVLNALVKRAAAEHGLSYPPDPSSFEISSIGGNLATNAGGLHCLRGGMTRQSVLALEVVLASGEVLRTGGRTVKRRAGYDLLSLFVGSEGTLGVITEATLRLRPARSATATAVAAFATVSRAADAIAAVMGSPLRVSALELMDQVSVRAVEAMRSHGLDRNAAATLLIEIEDLGPSDLDALEALCRAAGASDVAISADGQEQEWLMAARRAALPAFERIGTTIVDDVIVPRGRIADLLEATATIARERRTMVGIIGHAGDGNFHPNFVFDPADPGARAVAMAACNDVMAVAIGLGGSVTGEHGVGFLKRHFLERELDPVALATMRGLKHLLDPAGILNPGKAI